MSALPPKADIRAGLWRGCANTVPWPQLRDFLPRVEGIIIVDLSTWFNHEQKKNNASPGYRCEHDKKYFHDVCSTLAPPREIYATIDCTDDGENGFVGSALQKFRQLRHVGRDALRAGL